LLGFVRLIVVTAKDRRSALGRDDAEIGSRKHACREGGREGWREDEWRVWGGREGRRDVPILFPIPMPKAPPEPPSPTMTVT